MKTTSTVPTIGIQISPLELAELDDSGRITRGPREQIRQLTNEEIDHAFGAMEYLADRAAQMLSQFATKPEQKNLSIMEIEFGLGFNTELKIYVVGAKAEGSLRVKLAWKCSIDEEQ